MILTNEDRDALVQIQLLLTGVIKHIAMSELEENHERNFEIINHTKLNFNDDKNNEKEIEEISEDNNAEYGFLKFTEQEILKMPKNFRKSFRAQGKTVRYRERKSDRRYNHSYEARYAKKPYNNPPISVSAPTVVELKARFIEKLNNYVPNDKTFTFPSIPDTFDGYAIYWFENFHKCKVQPNTYKNNLALYERHIKEKLVKLSLCDITPALTQDLLQSLPGNGKTTDDVHSILNQIFDTAVLHGKMKFNPLNFFVHLQHDRESGIELSRDEEIKLLNAYSGSAYEIIYAVMLYTGLRPNEYKTAHIEGDFIVARNSKQKNGKIEYKKIPICSHLRSRIGNITELPTRHYQGIRKNYNKLFPGHMLKDLRKTFNTRCIECRVDTFARKKFMGHSVGKLDKTYTGTLDEYLLSEGLKLERWYTLYPKITPDFDE